MAKTAAAPEPSAKPAENAMEAPVKKKGKRKLLIVVGLIVSLMTAGGGVAVVMLKKKAAAHAAMAESDPEPGSQADSVSKVDINHPPVFVPLEPFVINLADRDSDRYAQIAVTLQVKDPQFAEKIKAFMPAIRNSILLVLTHKTSHELLERSGKQALAEEIMREAARPMGFNTTVAQKAEKEIHTVSADKRDDEPVKQKKKAADKEHDVEVNPIQQVHFANFIIQ